MKSTYPISVIIGDTYRFSVARTKQEDGSPLNFSIQDTIIFGIQRTYSLDETPIYEQRIEGISGNTFQVLIPGDITKNIGLMRGVYYIRMVNRDDIQTTLVPFNAFNIVLGESGAHPVNDMMVVYKEQADFVVSIAGHSPTVSVSKITGGHSVNVIDMGGEQSFNIMDGTPGSQIYLIDSDLEGNINSILAMTDAQKDRLIRQLGGIEDDFLITKDGTYLLHISRVPGTNYLTVCPKDESGKTFMDGVYIKGATGEIGPSPIKGVDYWTEKDISDIMIYIDQQLGVIENGSY